MFSWLSRFRSSGKSEASFIEPKQRRPRRSKEEMAAARAANTISLKARFRENSRQNRAKMAEIGVTRYRWSSCRDQRVCALCAENQGKVFDIGMPTKHGYPGEVDCHNGQACRCRMTPLIEDVDY